MAALRQFIADHIGNATGMPFEPVAAQALGGGCINDAEQLHGKDGRTFFVKHNRADRLAMFEAEALGLAELAAARAIRVPAPICHGGNTGGAFLVLEYLQLAGRRDDVRLGRELAALHRHCNSSFGWVRDNTIGSTPQVNARQSDWTVFFAEHRLRYQLDLASQRGAGHDLYDSGMRLAGGLSAFFTDYRPAASLLHGDLWSGNCAGLADGAPVIFDPAVYYGDRETDLAMMDLFGGFSARCMAAYREAWALDPGYAVRRELYQLYHVLNHFNLFGGGYRNQAQRMIYGLLAELR